MGPPQNKLTYLPLGQQISCHFVLILVRGFHTSPDFSMFTPELHRTPDSVQTSLCLLQNSRTPDFFLTLVCISCLHWTLQIPLDQAPHIHTYTYISPHVLLVTPRLIGIISPLWIPCGLLVAPIRHSTAAHMYLVPLTEGYSSARYSLVPGTSLIILVPDVPI